MVEVQKRHNNLLWFHRDAKQPESQKAPRTEPNPRRRSKKLPVQSIPTLFWGGASARQLRSYPTEIQVTKRLRHARKPIPAAILCQGQSPTKTVGSEAHLRMRLDRRRTGREMG